MKNLLLLAAFLAALLTASATELTLKWQDNSTDELGFAIERALGDGAFAQIATVGANVTTYVDRGLQPSTSYSYRVRAWNDNGASGYSNTATATTRGLPPADPSDADAQPAPAVDLTKLTIAAGESVTITNGTATATKPGQGNAKKVPAVEPKAITLPPGDQLLVASAR
jgi:hypothetical protein